MTIGFLPYGSSDSSVIFQHDLKSVLAVSDISGKWASLHVGDSTGWTAIGSAVDFPTHDANGLKQVAVSDGVTPMGYRFTGSITDLTNKGQLTFKIQRGAVEAYDATYNPNAWQPSSAYFPVVGFTATGNDHIYFLTIESGATVNAWHGCAHVSKDIENAYGDGSLVARGNPPKLFAANAYDEDGYATVHISWKGDFAILMIDGILVGYGNRIFAGTVLGSSDFLDNFYLGGRIGTAAEMLVDYYIKDLQIASEPASFSLSYDYPVVGVISDSMFDDVEFDATLASGGIYSGIGGIRRAFNEKGLLTNVVISENAGQKLDNSIVVTPSSITSVGTTATMTTASDPGWQTGETVSITGADQYRYNGSFSITRASGTSYTYTMGKAAPASPATGTITAGRSLQVSVKNLLNDNPKMAHIFVHGWTNDLSSSETAANTETDYKALIDTIFGYSNIKSMTVIVPPARLDGIDLDLQEAYNAMTSSLKSYVEANYSTKYINFADVWTASGGRSPVTGTIRSDNIHYAAKGASFLSKACYEAMKDAMSR